MSAKEVLPRRKIYKIVPKKSCRGRKYTNEWRRSLAEEENIHMSVEEVLQRLHVDDSDNSCAEDENAAPGADFQACTENFDSSDEETYDAAGPSALAHVDGEQSSNNQWSTLPSRANITWIRISYNTVRGKPAAENVFSARPGPTPFSHRGVQLESALRSFRLFVDEPMLRAIQTFTINYGKTEDESFSIELHELEKFIGVQIVRGVLVSKNTPIVQLRSEEYGHHNFGITMSRDWFEELMKHLRFHNFSTRSQRRQTDKFFL